MMYLLFIFELMTHQSTDPAVAVGMPSANSL